jgi:hypothetical protein
MPELDSLDLLFVITAFVFQLILIIHFALRKWRFALAMRYGVIVYVLGIPAALASLALLLGGKPWGLWLGGLLWLAWGAFGYWVEYIKKMTEWRSSIRWGIFIPYILLYLATSMFLWFPLSLVWKPLFYIQGGLFVISTLLNVTSHKPGGGGHGQPA